MRTTYILVNGELVEKTARMEAEAPNVIRDEIEPLKHMANGKMYTSKAKFRQATREAGCVEIGNEEVTKPRKPIVLDRRKRREDIRKALHDVRDGRAPRLEQLRALMKE